MNALNKDQLLAIICVSEPLVLKDVDGIGEIYIKRLTVSDQGEIAKKADANDNVGSGLVMIAHCVCDKDGKRLFTDGDIKQLGTMSANHMTALVTAISEVNGFDDKLADIKKN